MKRILISGLLLAAVTVAKAQNAEVDNAEKMVMIGQIDKAKESIDKAVLNPKTATLPKTYMIKAQVYTAIATDTSRHNLDYDPIQIASESLNKAKELDVKKTITPEDLKNASFNLYAAGYNKGLSAYNKEDFKTALKYFKFASEMNPSDTSLYLNTGVVAEKIKDTDAEEAAFMKLADMNYNKEPYIYKALYDIKKTKGDKEGAKAILEKGRTIFPNDNFLMVEELNMYLAEGKSDVIVDKLNKAIALDPSNKTLQFTLGVTYENLKKPDEAAAAYKKALEIDPNYFDANYNLGALYFNQAADIIKKANMMPANKIKEYDVEKQKFLKKAGEATPYLEKAYAINPKDRNVLISLKEIYSRTGAKDKYAKIDAELKALGD